MAHRKHGRLDWAALFDPAIEAAASGFKVTERLNSLLQYSADRLGPRARAYFLDDEGAPHPPGHVLRNRELAETFRRIAAGGAEAFYGGPIAREMVEAVRKAQRNPGDMTLADLADYRAKARAPVCGPYRAYRVCGMPPPTSGGLTVLQVLMMLERFDLGEESLNARALHLIAEAEKLAYADRAKYMADADFVEVPKGLIDRDYLRARSELISPHNAMDRAEPGDPPGSAGVFGDWRERGAAGHQPHLDHRRGRQRRRHDLLDRARVRLRADGARLPAQQSAHRFLFPPHRRRGPGDRQWRRSRQATAQLHVADDRVSGRRARDRHRLAGRQPHHPLHAEIADRRDRLGPGRAGGRVPAQISAAVAARWRWKAGHDWSAQAPRLRALGHNLRGTAMTSGIHMIIARDRLFEGGADPRRDGVALAD